MSILSAVTQFFTLIGKFAFFYFNYLYILCKVWYTKLCKHSCFKKVCSDYTIKIKGDQKWLN